MDEKLRKSLTAIICDIVECTEPLDCDMASTCPYVIDGLPQIEQAFRDNGWIKTSELTRKEFLGLSLEKRREILGREVKALESKPSPQRFASNSCEAMGMD
jgi:hypothetical protein